MSSKEAQLAQDLGAVVVADLRPTTTHLVGVLRQKTSKWKDAESMLQDAKCYLRHIVHLGFISHRNPNIICDLIAQIGSWLVQHI